jgi:hypothetical protein
VDGEIGALVEQRFFNLLSEQSLGPDLGERHVSDFVAGGFDDFDAALMPHAREFALDPTGLPKSELRTARCDNEHATPEGGTLCGMPR